MGILDLKTRDIVSWCEENVTLDYGLYQRERHPLMTEPLRACAKMRGGMVGLIGSVQCIKTLTAQLWHLYCMKHTPSRSAHYDLTAETLNEFSADKFTPLLTGCDAVMRTIPETRYAIQTHYMKPVYGSIRLLSANVLSNRNSKTLERVGLDEAWAYDAGYIGQILDRLTSYGWSQQVFIPSSGATKGSDLDKLWERSTQKVWHIPCDSCGEYQPLVWTHEKDEAGNIPKGGIRFDTSDNVKLPDGSWNYPELKKTIRYECSKCGHLHKYSTSSQHARNLKGKYISMNPNGEARLDFYNYNALAHFSWEDLVEQFVDATDAKNRGDLDLLENFVRKRLASPWDTGKYISQSDAPKASGGYQLGDPWDKAKYYFCTIDTQKDHWYYIIRAWSDDVESRLIERGKVVSDNQIVDACKRWNIPQGGLDPQIGCRVFIDGNYNTSEVARLCAKNGWTMLRGDNSKPYRHDDGVFRIYSKQQYVDAFEGTGQAGSNYAGQFWFSNNEAMLRLSTIRGIVEPTKLWTYADNAGEDYEKQINAWVRIAKKRAKDNSTYYDFVQRYRHDHYGDCEKMQIVVANMAGLVGQQGS